MTVRGQHGLVGRQGALVTQNHGNIRLQNEVGGDGCVFSGKCIHYSTQRALWSTQKSPRMLIPIACLIVDIKKYAVTTEYSAYIGYEPITHRMIC